MGAHGRLAAEAVEGVQDTQRCDEIVPRNHRDKAQGETGLM
jgi:hypothetical protein